MPSRSTRRPTSCRGAPHEGARGADRVQRRRPRPHPGAGRPCPADRRAHPRAARRRASRPPSPRRHETPYAVAVSSGTSAIEIILRGHSASTGARWSCRPTRSSPPRPRSLHAGGRVRFADVDAAHARPVGGRRSRPRSRRDTAAVVLVHIGGIVTPDDRGDPRLVRPRAACRSSRTRPTPTAASFDGQAGRHLRRRRRVLVLPDQGHHQRRGRHDRHRRRSELRDEALHLPRPGQGRLPAAATTCGSATTGG